MTKWKLAVVVLALCSLGLGGCRGTKAGAEAERRAQRFFRAR